MADVVLKCPKCGEQTRVSEYVDPSMAKCKACGHALDVPQKEVKVVRQAPLKEPEPIAKLAQRHVDRSAVTASRVIGEMAKRRKKRRRLVVWSPSSTTIIVIFVVGAAILSALRWGGVFHGGEFETLKTLGIAGLLVLYATVIVDAFGENIMNGLLSIFVPFYALYHLYTQCDSFPLRILVGIFCVAFGLDTVVFLYNDVVLKFMHMLATDQTSYGL